MRKLMNVLMALSLKIFSKTILTAMLNMFSYAGHPR